MKKGMIFGGIGGVLLLLVIWVVIVAMGVGGEASKMDTMLKGDITRHAKLDEVKQQLTQAGYAMQGDAPKMTATGPKHSLVVYSTYLTLDLGFGQDGTLTSYHLDRV